MLGYDSPLQVVQSTSESLWFVLGALQARFFIKEVYFYFCYVCLMPVEGNPVLCHRSVDI